MLNPVDMTVKDILTQKLVDLETLLSSDILTMYGPILDGTERIILKLVEELANDPNKKDRICIVLTTPGGIAETVERYVHILRHNYTEVNFIVPDYAFSAGTIFCMSGDNIYMDYFSVLGPIDPQVRNKEGKFVGALGYLDKINELLERARNKTLSQAEFLILKDFDLAELKGYEQARDLTVDLLKRWLVNFKFKDWNQHQTDPGKKGQAVTIPEKEQRAAEIAAALSDNNKWKSHGRPINIERLETDLRLKIENYSSNKTLRDKVNAYHDMLTDYVSKNNTKNFYHTRRFF